MYFIRKKALGGTPGRTIVSPLYWAHIFFATGPKSVVSQSRLKAMQHGWPGDFGSSEAVINPSNRRPQRLCPIAILLSGVASTHRLEADGRILSPDRGK
jgi:hypothetical protein